MRRKSKEVGKLEENKDYRAYRYGDRLEPGKELKIEHSIFCDSADISSLITQGMETLQAMRQDSIEGEKKAFDIVVAAANQWEKQAAVTQNISRALEYLRTPEVAHTANRWQVSPRNDDWEEISNRVYRMTCSIWEHTRYDREIKKSVADAWYVSWDVYVQSPKQQHGYGEKIAGQRQKRYTDKAAAEKYLEGRKKAYSHLFQEISPQVSEQYAHYFTVNGALLPGYTVEGQEPEKTGHAAADVPDGGPSMPEKEKKPSVLEKLSAAKEPEKTPAVSKAANKKKEDMQI